MILPDSQKDLTRFALDTIELCKVSQGQRSAAYRVYGQWIETGRAAGGLALANVLYGHVDRLQSHLFSPGDLRFMVDYEGHYGKREHAMAQMGGRVLTRQWARRRIDEVFGSGVGIAVAYGAAFIKELVSERTGYGGVKIPVHNARLVMPWQMGLYNESITNIVDQEAVLETVWLSKDDVWRRIRHLPDAEKLFKRIVSSSSKDTGVGIPTSFMHQVLSTAVLNPSLTTASQPQPGGMVQLSNDPTFATLGPQVSAQLIPMHELWVKNEDGNDWITIQIIEPDILVCPLYKRINLFCPETLPYTMIQPNQVANYAWGRSEIVDLMELQNWLTTHMDDVRRLMGQQVDKLLAFPGYDGMTDEAYGQFRSQGYLGLPQGATVSDLTPKMPENAIPLIREILSLMDHVSGFPKIMSGQGESGVRSGQQTDTLMKTGSPRLRDRSLTVERQCSEAGEVTFSAIEAKDGRQYSTESMDEDPEAKSTFLMSQLPDDREVTVDSHSSSPIYMDDHRQEVAFGLKAGLIGGDDAIEMLNFKNKDYLIRKWKEREKAKAAQIQKLMERDPKAAEKLMKGGKR